MSELSQEEIRRKRLARLEAQNSNPGPSTSQPVSPSASQNATPFIPPPAPVDRGTPPPQKTDSQSTDTSSQMEVEELSQSEDKNNAISNSQVDVDSGIENMEVEESKELTQQRATSNNESYEDQIQSTISRVLRVTWSQGQQNDSSIFIPETAAGLNQNKQEGDAPIESQDIISQSLMEVMCQIASGENPMPSPLTCLTPDNSSENIAEPSRSRISTSSLLPPSLATTGLAYLTDCYARVANEERNNPKRCSTQPLKELLAEVRAQCVQHTLLMLQDILMEEVDFTGRLGPLSSPLLQPVLEQSLPRGFLLELLARTHSNPVTINKVFSPLLQGLYRSMQGASIVGNSHRKPLEALSDLVDMRVGPTANLRPVCHLITHQALKSQAWCKGASPIYFSTTMALNNVVLISQLSAYVIAFMLSLCITIPMSLHQEEFRGHCLLFSNGTWTDEGQLAVNWASQAYCNYTIFVGVLLSVVAGIQIYRMGMYLYKETDSSFLSAFVDVVSCLALCGMTVAAALMITLGFMVWCGDMTERFPSCEIAAGNAFDKLDGIDTANFYIELGTAQFGAWASMACWVGLSVFAMLKLCRYHQLENMRVSMFRERQRLINESSGRAGVPERTSSPSSIQTPAQI